jgi:hypothetical protein
LGRVYGSPDLVWDGDTLRLGKTGRVMAIIERDGVWPKLWRVRVGGRLLDMVNRTRARDAARSLALAALNQRSAKEAKETGA